MNNKSLTTLVTQLLGKPATPSADFEEDTWTIHNINLHFHISYNNLVFFSETGEEVANIEVSTEVLDPNKPPVVTISHASPPHKSHHPTFTEAINAAADLAHSLAYLLNPCFTQITKEQALMRFEANLEVYIHYPENNSESLVQEVADIIAIDPDNKDSIFVIEIL